MNALDHPILVCLGGGGVGKTTLAAGAAIAAAQRGERVMVLTIDPARRLSSTLGLGLALGNEPMLVEGPWPGELWAAMLDPSATLRSILEEHGSKGQTARILANPLFATIVESLSGSNEYLAAERLHQLHHDERFDRVVVDTPPSRHAIDFLESPDRMSRFLHNRLYRLVLAPRRGLLRPVSSAAHVIMRATAKLVGADLVDNVIRLFADMEGLDDGFRRRATETAALLAGPQCGYVVIASPRHEPIREALWILDRLDRQGRSAAAVIVNRLAPFGRQTPPPQTGRRTARRKALTANWDELTMLARLEDEVIDKLRGELPSDLPIITVSEQAGSTTSVEALAQLARQLQPRPYG